MSLISLGFWANNNIIPNGLTLYLDAGNTLSYPGSGTTWIDIAGTADNGTLTGGPTFDSAVGGNIVFDGSNDYVLMTTTNNSNNYDYITICAWVKASAGSRGYIVSAQFGTGEMPYHLNVGGNASSSVLDGFAFYTLSTWNNSGIVTDIRGDGNWHFVCGTFNGTSLVYYVDGVSNSSDTVSATVLPKNSEVPRIGSYFVDFEFFTGSISQVFIYNRALSSTEILQNYNVTKSRFGL